MISRKPVASAALVLCLGALGIGGGCSSEGVVNPGDGAEGGSSTGGVSSGGVPTGGSAGTGFSGGSGGTSGAPGTGGAVTGGQGGTSAGAAGMASGGSGGQGGTAGAAGTASGGTGGQGGTAGVSPGGAAGRAGSGGASGTAGVSSGGAAGRAGASGAAGSGSGCATAGQVMCGTTCVNTQTNPLHCGGCGMTCPSGQTCANGACTGGTTTGVIGWAAVSGNGVTTTTGGSGGTTVDVSTASALQSAASSSTRQTIRLTASVSVPVLDVASNKTIVGVGNNITISGGIEINNVNNVILQNIKLNARTTGVNGDGIRITGSHHVWIDHMEVWDAPDGNMDISEASNYITVSWTKFWYSANPPNDAHRYSNLIGSGDGETADENALNVTWHHNWWAERVHERMPRVRFGDVHVFNNYYSSSGNNYCIRAGYRSNVLIENNHFQGVDTPHEMGEDQGTAVVTARGNQYTNTTGAQGTRGTAFTPPYQYTLEPASSVAAAVMSGAGPR
jgi:pectate lyase